MQLFEVLSAYIMSLVESDFAWTVTPLQHDGGVDFFGEKRLFSLPGYDDFKVVIAGQCKASASVRQPLTPDLLRLLSSAKPAVVYIFLLTPLSQRRIDAAQRLFLTETHRPCRILGLQSVVDLFGIHRQQVLTLIGRSVSGRDQQVLHAFIAQLPALPAASGELSVRVPERVLAGTPFPVRINFASLLLKGTTVHVRWDHPPDLTLIKPGVLLTPEGLRLEPTEAFRAPFSLKLVTYQIGEIGLGQLTVEAAGKEIQRVTLGSVTSVDQYHPTFYWEPYHSQRLQFLQLLEQAEAGTPQAIAILGQGGSGKTRFCQELGYLAEQRGGEFISIAHPKDLRHPYRVFGLLLEELLAESLDATNPQEGVEAYIREVHSPLQEGAIGTIAAAFARADHDEPGFDRNVMLHLLLLILLRKATRATYILHFSDLHWASTDVLDLLGDVLRRLTPLACTHPVRLLMVFEGRTETDVEIPSVPEATTFRASTAVLASFLSRFGMESLTVRTFTRAESRTFLEYLFEKSQSTARRIPRQLIPHQELLIRAICRHGAGNPFHMIEQIKLLRHEETVHQNKRTGLIYLARPPGRSYKVPTSVYDLISLRMRFIERSSPELALLIKAVGLVKDRVEMELFERLHRGLAPNAPLARLRQLELLSIEGPSHVGFSHENYYQVVRDWKLAPRERTAISAVYLAWYRRHGRRSAEAVYEEALIRKRQPRPNRLAIRKLLTQALAMAERSHQYQLAIGAIEQLLQADTLPWEVGSVPSGALLASLHLRSKLARFLIEVRDWSLGAEQQTGIIATLTDCLNTARGTAVAMRVRLNYLRAAALVELANAKSDLGRAQESIHHLQEARAVCEGYFARSSESPHQAGRKWYVLYGRLLNRLGEANWMDGNYSEALRCLEAATAAIDTHIPKGNERRLRHHINLLDYGAVLLHRSPRRAVQELRRSLALVPAKGWPPHYRILAEITLVIGEMVELFLHERSVSRGFRHFVSNRGIPQLLGNFEQATFYGLKQEQVAASLVLGVSLSLLQDDAAVRWYMESVEIAFRSSNLESLWRGHLNLAQWLTSLGDVEAGRFHCHRAAALLADDLRRRRPEERRWRQRHLNHPFGRIRALLPPMEFLAIAADLQFVTPVSSRLPARSYFSRRIIFFPLGENEYYPYGG